MSVATARRRYRRRQGSQQERAEDETPHAFAIGSSPSSLQCSRASAQLLLVVLAFVAAACGGEQGAQEHGWNDDRHRESADRGKMRPKAPAVAGTTLDGEQLALADFAREAGARERLVVLVKHVPERGGRLRRLPGGSPGGRVPRARRRELGRGGTGVRRGVRLDVAVDPGSRIALEPARWARTTSLTSSSWTLTAGSSRRTKAARTRRSGRVSWRDFRDVGSRPCPCPRRAASPGVSPRPGSRCDSESSRRRSTRCGAPGS